MSRPSTAWRKLGWKVVAAAVVVGIVTASVLMWRAGRVVDDLLSRPIWAEAGQITGTARIATSMNLGPDDLSDILLKAGFSRVQNVDGPNEFAVGPSGTLVQRSNGQTLVTFDDTRITSVSPDGLLMIEGVELTATAGPNQGLREPVRSSQLPKYVSRAILAMEDSRFFEHPGFDWIGIGRAFAANLFGDGVQQGGSTLTQQLAKNLFLNPERTVERKLRELFLALALEQRLTKTEILDLYLNQVYLGQIRGVGIGGIGQAARAYFGVSPQRLSLAQSATLAGIISAPNRYSPVRHAEKAKERRDLVLQRMVDLGWIPEPQSRLAQSGPVSTIRTQSSKTAPWAIDHATDVVEAVLGKGAVAKGPLRIRTTIDPGLQKVAERSVENALKALGSQHEDTQVALVAINAMNGHILAMVGGRHYGSSTFNRAVHGRRQIGSTVKPFSWLFAYDADPALHPNSMVEDVPLSLQIGDQVWEPDNYDGMFENTVSMKDALGRSRNVPAVKVAQTIGFEQLMLKLASIGIGPKSPVPAISLGAFEASPLALSGAYAVFPQQGKYVPPRVVDSVRLPDGSEGWNRTVRKIRVASKRAAFLASTDLRGVMTMGTGRTVGQGIHGGHWVAGKTGTTDDARDAWFVGYSGQLVVSVWVGFDKGRALGLTGAQAAGPIFGSFMDGSGWLETEGPPVPSSVERFIFCSDSHKAAGRDETRSYEGWISTGTQIESCPEDPVSATSRTRAILESLRNSLRSRSKQNQVEPTAGPEQNKKGWFRRKRSADDR